MKLTVLGSSSAIFNPKVPYRYPASHLIEVKGCKILFDAGIGVLPQITKLGLTVSEISVIAISHFHADHFVIQPLLQAYFLEGKFGGNKPSLHLLGPKGLIERVKTGFDQSGFSYDNDLVPNVDISFTEYEDGQNVSIVDGVTLTPYKTIHYELDAYALRLESGNKALAYSGDSTVSDGLEKSAKSADLFLCEAFRYVGQDSDMGHVSARDAAITAQKADSKKLVLTHYSGNDSNSDIEAEARASGFVGEISVAIDLDTYNL